MSSIKTKTGTPQGTLPVIVPRSQIVPVKIAKSSQVVKCICGFHYFRVENWEFNLDVDSCPFCGKTEVQDFELQPISRDISLSLPEQINQLNFLTCKKENQKFLPCPQLWVEYYR